MNNIQATAAKQPRQTATIYYPDGGVREITDDHAHISSHGVAEIAYTDGDQIVTISTTLPVTITTRHP